VAGKILRGLGKLSIMAEIVAQLPSSQTNQTGLFDAQPEPVREEKSVHFVSAEGHLNGKAPERLAEEEVAIAHEETVEKQLIEQEADAVFV
jgi:hypothetical protein